MAWIEKALRVLSRTLVVVAGFFLLAMMLHVFADVSFKYLFNYPIPGTAEIVSAYYMLAAVFIPLPFVEMRNAGISVDLFYFMFPTTVRRAILLLAYCGQTAFFALLAYQTTFDSLKALSIGEYVSGQILVTVWPATFFLPIGFTLAGLVSLLRIAQIIRCPNWEQITSYDSSAEIDRPVGESS